LLFACGPFGRSAQARIAAEGHLLPFLPQGGGGAWIANAHKDLARTTLTQALNAIYDAAREILTVLSSAHPRIPKILADDN
jgi:hypothetical protein